MKPSIRLLFRSAFLPSLLALGHVPSAMAAPITWGSATTITGDAGSGIAVKNFQPNNNVTYSSTTGTADVFSTGTSVFAMVFTGVSGDTWINRVTFFESTPQQTVFLSGDDPGAFTQNGVTLALGGGSWSGNTRIAGNSPQGSSYGTNPGYTWDTLSYMRYMNATSGTLTFSGLAIGQEYAIQYWVQDSRTGAGDINDRNLDLAGSTPVTLDYNNGAGVGQWAVGTFTADSSTQDIAITANSSVQINMIQLRALPAVFTSADGIWTGGGGNWSTASNWDANTIGQGIDKSATFNGPTPVTAAVDVVRPIGALLFFGANHTLSNGTGNLTLDGDITYPTPTVNVAVGTTATVNATLTGTEGLLKSGTGTLVLGGTSSYSGSTSITAGTLSYAGGSFASATHGIATGAALEFNVAAGTYNASSTTINGGGTLRKTGAGNLIWPATSATFALDPGALIDVQGGSFTAGSYGNESWSGNLSDLNVASGAVFSTVEANVRVDKITGSGSIGTGFSGGGYQNLTIGVADGSSTFDGVITNTDGNPAFVGNLVKTGTGTIALTGVNTYTGTTTVEAGTLSLSQAFLNDNAQVIIGLNGILNLGFVGTDVVGSIKIDGTELTPGIYNSSHSTYGSYFTGTGSLEILGGNGTWTSLSNGDWSVAGNWSGGTVASGFDSIATFNAATGVTVNLDSSRTIGGLTFGTTGYTLAGSSTLTLNSSSDISTLTVGSGLTAAISAKLATVDALNKAGAGTLTLSAQNNFSSAITVSEGVLALATDWTLGNVGTGTAIVPGLVTVESGATLRAFNALANQLNGLVLNGGTVDAVGGGNADWGNFHLTGNVTATGTSNLNAEVALRAANVDFFVDSGSTLNVGGVMHNGAFYGIYRGAPANVSKSGDGTMILSAANTYTGFTTINGGTLELADSGQLTFVVSDSGQNIVGGTGTAIFRGDFAINTSAVTGTTGGIWLLVDVANLNPASSFESTFTVVGYDDSNNDGIWTMTDAKGDWSFDESTGELTLNVGSDYDDWATANGVAGAEEGDDDSDGLTNFEEYAFGLDPTGSSEVNPIVVPLDKATGKFRYTRRATPTTTGLTYTVWTSTDLATWTEDAGATLSQSVTGTVGEVETVEATLTGGLQLAQPKLFIQVRAQ